MHTKKRGFLAIITAFVMVIALIGCGSTNTGSSDSTGSANTGGQSGGEQNAGGSSTPKGPDSIQFPSGSVGGGYYQVAGIIGKEMESALNIPVTVMPSGGSGENINLMEQGEVQMAVAAANTLWPAYNNTLQYEGKPKYENFRLVAMLYENPVLFYALKGSGMETIQDLKGKRVGVGASPAAWDHLTGPVLEAHGVSYANGIEKVYVGFGDAATQVSDGLLDSTVSNVGMPAIQQIAAQKELTYLKFDETAAEKLSQDFPYIKQMTVDGSALPGYTGGEYPTIDIGGPYLIVHKDLPDETVYEVTKALYENIKKLSENSADLRAVAADPDKLATPLGEVPFHPGAEKFWKEKGLR